MLFRSPPMKIETVHQLLETASARYFTSSRGQWVFRGHSDEAYDLRPAVGRGGHTSSSTQKYEKSLFDIFTRETGAYLSPLPANEWEWLSVAQHHGLPTRMLDWSHNPLVALYFTVSQCPGKSGVVFALNAPRKAPRSMLAKSPFDVTRPVKYYPNIVSPRIRAQEGLFVVCPQPDVPFDNELRGDWKTERIEVPAEAKQRLQYELFRLGVHESSLFPHLDGLARRVKWQHTVPSLVEQTDEGGAGDETV